MKESGRRVKANGAYTGGIFVCHGHSAGGRMPVGVGFDDPDGQLLDEELPPSEPVSLRVSRHRT
jgi:hypothetical protein